MKYCYNWKMMREYMSEVLSRAGGLRCSRLCAFTTPSIHNVSRNSRAARSTASSKAENPG